MNVISQVTYSAPGHREVKRIEGELKTDVKPTHQSVDCYGNVVIFYSVTDIGDFEELTKGKE